MEEKLFTKTSENESEVQVVEGLSEDERNERAVLILEKIVLIIVLIVLKYVGNSFFN